MFIVPQLLASVSSLAITGPVAVVSQDFLTNQTAPSWLDVSGIVGNRMMYDSTGKLTYAPNNLLPQSNTFSNSAWTKDNVTVAQNATDYLGNANSAWTMTDNATSGMHRTYLTDSNQSASAVFSVVAKAGTANFIGLQIASGLYTVFDLSTGTVTGTNLSNGVITSLGNGWYRCAVRQSAPWQYTIIIMGTTEAQAASGSYVGSGSTILISDAVKAYVTYETSPRSADLVRTTTAAYYGPRFDFDPNTLAARGLLIEESRVNYLLQSNAFNNASWTNTTPVTLTAASATSPDGTNNGWKAQSTVTIANQQNIQQGITATAGTVVTASAYVKYGNNQWTAIAIYDGSWLLACFDTQNGVWGTASAGLATNSPVNVGNGWYRISITRTLANANPTFGLFMRNANSTTPTYTAAGTEFNYWYGAQMEVGTFATSYIPTTTASVTRVADLIKLSGAALSTIQGAAGTVIQEVSVLGDTGSNMVLLGGSSTYALFVNTTDDTFGTYNASSILSSGQACVYGTPGRVGVAWDAAPSRAISANGAAAVSQASSFGSVGSNVGLGSLAGTTWSCGWHRGISFYNSKLTGATFTGKTVVGSAY